MDSFYIIAWLFIAMIFPLGIISAAIAAKKQGRTSKLTAKIAVAIAVYMLITLVTGVWVVKIVLTLGYVASTNNDLNNIESVAFILLYAVLAWLFSSLIYGRFIGLGENRNPNE